MTATAETTVGQLVTHRPGRARIFESFGIDYCCGGKKPLAQACNEKGIDVNVVLGVLRAFDEQSPATERDWSTASLTELADHIEHTHHAYLKQELPRLDYLTNKVASRHGPDRPALVELRDLFQKFQAELMSHMWKEENVLFPLCRQFDGAETLPPMHCGTVDNPIRVMIHEHDDAGTDLARMREITDNYALPEHACNTYRALFQSLIDLEQDMHRHVHKENSILFPKALETEGRLRGQAPVGAN